MTRSETFDCREFLELVTEYLEGRLEPPTRVHFEEHLSRCDGCEGYLDDLRQTLTAIGRVPEESLPVEVEQRLLRAFRLWKRPH